MKYFYTFLLMMISIIGTNAQIDDCTPVVHVEFNEPIPRCEGSTVEVCLINYANLTGCTGIVTGTVITNVGPNAQLDTILHQGCMEFEYIPGERVVVFLAYEGFTFDVFAFDPGPYDARLCNCLESPTGNLVGDNPYPIYEVLNDSYVIYDLIGRQITTDVNSLKTGVYIIDYGNGITDRIHIPHQR